MVKKKDKDLTNWMGLMNMGPAPNLENIIKYININSGSITTAGGTATVAMSSSGPTGELMFLLERFAQEAMSGFREPPENSIRRIKECALRLKLTDGLKVFRHEFGVVMWLHSKFLEAS